MRTDPEQLTQFAMTTEAAMDLLSALEAVQLEAVSRNEWFRLRLKSHELAILRDTYHRLAELRSWLQDRATEELQCQNLPAP
jgi:hypothetical protein